MPADVPAPDELIRRCRAGEEAARAELFTRYRHYLHVLAQAQLGRHLRGKCDPSDIVQQTLLEAHRDFPAFQGSRENELLAWLRRILAHNLFNEARRFATRGRDATRELSLEGFQAGVDHSSQVLARGLADDGPTPSEAAAEREAAVQLADVLTRLPENYQQVLLLRLFEGLSADEVARRTNTTAGAVRMLQMRALASLREEMKNGERRMKNRE
jgi:RNA polymerase sigma-70 factor (ECF subfamily)